MPIMQNPSTAVLILAAGASVRLGRPKQSLLYQGQTLVQKIVSTALALQSGPVLLVLKEGDSMDVQEDVIKIYNPDAALGMATSIHSGIKYLETQHADIETVIITVCDQPFITSSLLQEMITHYRETKLRIVACKYDDIVGTPVLFHKTMFKALYGLNGDKGAKQLINQHIQQVGLINFPLGNIDVDTEEDYERLIKL
jgi:molybdenum cofactor cytidylyltransferase